VIVNEASGRRLREEDCQLSFSGHFGGLVGWRVWGYESISSGSQDY